MYSSCIFRLLSKSNQSFFVNSSQIVAVHAVNWWLEPYSRQYCVPVLGHMLLGDSVSLTEETSCITSEVDQERLLT